MPDTKYRQNAWSGCPDNARSHSFQISGVTIARAAAGSKGMSVSEWDSSKSLVYTSDKLAWQVRNIREATCAEGGGLSQQKM